MKDGDLIEIGFIREAHALRGQVVVHAYSGQEESLTQYGPLLNADGSKSYTLDVINAKGNDFLCTVKGVTDRNAAEALRGTKLFTPASKLPPIEAPDEFYVRDLIGLTVKNNSGTVLGKVKDVIDLGVHSAFDIEFIHNGENELPEGQRELMLYTTENVLNIDVPGKTIVISLPHGLLEIIDKPA
jgi:16S rRNA processing protein RimM